MAQVAARGGHKAAKRGNPLPWAKAGHNGPHPASTDPMPSVRRKESGGDRDPKPKVVRV